MMVNPTSLFGAIWPWWVLAGVWSLGCGWSLRRAWEAPAKAARASELTAARGDALRLQANADSARSQIQALETDLVKQRHQVVDVEATGAAELQLLTMKLASNGAKAAGFDQANEASLRALAERDRAVAALNAQRQASEAAQADARAQADRNAALTRLRAEANRSTPAPSRHDDLKRIECIGLNTELLLNEAGYRRFSDVAQADPKALAAVLEKSGPRFILAGIDTWPEQARLLASGDMEAFRRLTDELKGGVRR